MNFDETNKVIIDTMNQQEASAFVKFLESEIARHEQDIDEANKLIQEVSGKFKLYKRWDISYKV